MKQTTRILTLLLALALLLTSAGCLVPEEKTPEASEKPASNGNTEPSAPVDTANYDPEAVAVELGSIKITAGEIEESYNYYVNMLESYYGVEVSDDESIREYREMAISDLIRYYIPQWKAEELGVKLTADEEAAVEQDVSEQIDALRTGIICDYAYYYGGAAETYDDIAKLSEEELNLAMEEINAELVEYYYEGYTLENYLEEQQKSMVNDTRISKLTDKLRESQIKDYIPIDEQVNAWYDTTLAAQQESFDADPTMYRDVLTAFKDGDSLVPALYKPEGMLEVQLIEIAPKEERDLKIETNRAEMSKLESEYGKLLLNNEDLTRQEEIKALYLQLKAENDVLEEAYIGETRAMINKAYEALEEETPFEDVMAQYNEGGLAIETVLFTEGDELYGDLGRSVAELLVGTYSEPLLIDDVYYIVKLIGKPQAGVIDRASIADAVNAAAADEATEDEWNALYSEWETEAETAAIRHEDAYAAIGYMN